MSTVSVSKINQLLANLPSGIVVLSPWLQGQGYSLELQKRYRNSGWLASIGSGAMVRSGDQVDYLGAVYALQVQAGMSVHPAGKTALGLSGKTHYLELGKSSIRLFGDERERLPAWMKNYNWDRKIEYYSSSFLPAELGLTAYPTSTFTVKISTPARAIMECLYLAPDKQDLVECYQLMEGLNALVPAQVQILLESCRSVKVKRLFLFLAEKAGHRWLSHIKQEKLNLGSGKRSIVKDGVYIPKYQITVPKELASYGKTGV